MTHQDLPARCPECGAPQPAGLGCWDLLGHLLAWEWQDEDLLQQHFLTVASYNLQHPARFAPEAIEWLRLAFNDHLDQGTSVWKLRKRAAHTYHGNQKVLRPEGEQVAELQDWAMTVWDVVAPGPAGAAGRVRAWAKSIREQL